MLSEIGQKEKKMPDDFIHTWNIKEKKKNKGIDKTKWKQTWEIGLQT